MVKGGGFEVSNGLEEVRCVGVSGDVSSEGCGGKCGRVCVIY